MNNQTTAQWRQATADDLVAIDTIGNGVHLSLPERPEVFAEKLDLSPPGCLLKGKSNHDTQVTKRRIYPHRHCNADQNRVVWKRLRQAGPFPPEAANKAATYRDRHSITGSQCRR
jgi:hypothetical protein